MAHDLTYLFFRSPLTVVAAILSVAIMLAALMAPLLASMDPFDPAQVFLADANIPPVWQDGGDPRFVLGTDDQGRDIFSAIKN